MGPNIELCGIPDKSIWKTLSVPFIFTSYILRFKYVYTKITVSSDKHMHEALQQVNHDEYSQKLWGDP